MPQTRGEIPLVLARKCPTQKKNNRVLYRMLTFKQAQDSIYKEFGVTPL